ncbi:noggin-2 [Centruroides vittatus]|uniref:noggin-2 n=1 Tax=Centruroides vittatus TaxID=120091 RepID=UPI00351084BB
MLGGSAASRLGGEHLLSPLSLLLSLSTGSQVGRVFGRCYASALTRRVRAKLGQSHHSTRTTLTTVSDVLTISMHERGTAAVWLLAAVSLVAALPTPPRYGRLQVGIRPSPSHDLPVMDLIEPPDKIYDPKPEEVNVKALRDKMGRNYDPKFMSEQRPVENLLHPNGTTELGYRRNKKGRLVPAGNMPNEIRHLRLHNIQFPDGSRVRMKVGKKMRRKFKQLLWAYTYCPVTYRWKDLGVRFWPRWIREGSCTNVGSCSFPRGMSCKPRKSVNKLVLRWHCQNWNQKKLCKWIPVRYPIITECSCSC